MGRPINKKFFGVNASDNIKVQFNNGTASVAGYIVKQKGAKKFLCSDATGVQAICTLVDKASANLAVGEMSITVKADDGTVSHVTKISGHTVTAGGVRQPWNFSTSTSDTIVQIEEAGTGIDSNATPTTADDTLSSSTDLEGDGA